MCDEVYVLQGKLEHQQHRINQLKEKLDHISKILTPVLDSDKIDLSLE